MTRKRFESGSSSVAANIEDAKHSVANLPPGGILAEVVVPSRSDPETGSWMEPSSEHEREITRLMDERDHQTRLPLAAVVDFADSLTFTPSKEELQFLVRYFLWWRDRQILA